MRWRGQSQVKPFCSQLCNQMASHQLTVLHSAVLSDIQSPADLTTNWSPSTLNHIVMLYRAALSSTITKSRADFSQTGHRLHSTTLSCCTMLHSAVPLDTQSPGWLYTSWSPSTLNHIIVLYRAALSSIIRRSVTGWLYTSWSPSTLNHIIVLYRAALSSIIRRSDTSWPFPKLVMVHTLHSTTRGCCIQVSLLVFRSISLSVVVKKPLLA